MSFNHLKEHKLKHKSQNTVDIDTKAHYFVHCHVFMHKRQTFLDSVSQIYHDILKSNIISLLFNCCWEIPNKVFRLTLNC